MPEQLKRVRRRRALISVFDKTGIVDLASGLIELGWEILASSGTSATLAAEGLPVTDVADYTGYPPLLGHRVVTLHPRVHGGILADGSDPEHAEELSSNRIGLIDLVVVNLYPFDDRPGVDTIDIGGPTLLRAAAKNHSRVGVVADPADYPMVLSELTEHSRLSDAIRLRLARAALAHTIAHDQAVATWLDARLADASAHPPSESGEADSSTAAGSSGQELPASLHVHLERAEILRYGENPHQRAARYRHRGRLGFFDRAIRPR